MMKLFRPFKINSVKLKNRLIVGPMCQYSAKNGAPTEWHYNHYKKLSKLGAGLVILESTAVSKEGRITKRVKKSAGVIDFCREKTFE